jgi:outer membrane receptor for ferric coprogen and ferric-rhodotorulic acid
MGKKKNTNFRLFEGRKANDRHVRITQDMITSKAWTSLKATSVKLYISLKLRYTGTVQNEIEFPHTEVEKIGISKDCVKKCFDDLIKCGFIECVHNGRFDRTPNKYKLSSVWQEYK